jgi:thiol-disulfide isomerase/thioredoxin
MKLAATVFAICLALSSLAQDDKKKAETDTLKPYQKYTSLPAFNILEMDSLTLFNTYNIPKGKPVALMLFSPDCKHCKRTINALCASMDSIKDVQFYMVTGSHSMTDIRKVYKEHHLADYKNIIKMGRDPEFFFLSYYGTKFVPDVALYDEHKKLIKLIEGETTATEIYKALHH